MQMLMLVALLALPLAAGAQSPRAPSASRWARIGTTSAGNAVFLDGRSVRRADGIVTATVRAVFAPPVKTPRGTVFEHRKPGLPGYGPAIRGTLPDIALNHLCPPR